MARAKCFHLYFPAVQKIKPGLSFGDDSADAIGHALISSERIAHCCQTRENGSQSRLALKQP
jgi:hypothetical protein